MATSHITVYYAGYHNKRPYTSRTIPLVPGTTLTFVDAFNDIIVNRNVPKRRFTIDNIKGIRFYIDKTQSKVYTYSQFKEILNMFQP